MGVKALAIGAAITVVVAGCGSSKEPPPFKTVPQTTTDAATATETDTGGSVRISIASLGPHYSRVFAPLIDGQKALDTAAHDVAAAVSDAQSLADEISGGNNAPRGDAPQVTRLSAALSTFDGALREVSTSTAQLPRLTAELQARAGRLSKRKPRQAAALLSAKQRVDAALAQAAQQDRALAVAQNKVDKQKSMVALDAGGLRSAASAAGNTATAAASSVDGAVSAGFEALVRAM
jgi:hypothetical protein